MILKVNLQCHNTDYTSYNISFICHLNLSNNQSHAIFGSVTSKEFCHWYIILQISKILDSCVMFTKARFELEQFQCSSFCFHYEMIRKSTLLPSPSQILKHMVTSLRLTIFYAQENLTQNVFKFACDCKNVLYFQMMNWVKFLVIH